MIFVDIGGIGNKVLNGVEKNAALLSFAGSAVARGAEMGYGLDGSLRWLINHFTNLGMPTTPGAGGYGALGEAILTVTQPDLLAYKLFGSGHLYSTLTKAGVAAWLAGELGVIGPRWKKLGKDVAVGAIAAAIVMPGSGPGGSPSGNAAGTYSY